VSVGEDEAAVGESRADVMRYLGWHGITAKARQVKPLSRSVGDTLLHEASEAEIGMLVMGAYSHSRVRELLLGEVTRHVLSNVTLPPVSWRTECGRAGSGTVAADGPIASESASKIVDQASSHASSTVTTRVSSARGTTISSVASRQHSAAGPRTI
jgi:hypothetical protein